MITLSIAWTYIKRYAWLFFAVVAGVLAMVVFAKGPSDMANQINAINKRHSEEIERIRAAEETRLREHQENQQRLEETLKMLDDRYKKALTNLDVEKRVEVDRILKKHKDDPDALAAELAAVLGFQVQKL